MLACWDCLLKPISLTSRFWDIGVTVIIRATKLKTRKPQRNPSRPANRMSNTFGNETLYSPVKKMKLIPNKIRNVPVAMTVRTRAQPYDVSQVAGTTSIMTGLKYMARYIEITILNSITHIS